MNCRHCYRSLSQQAWLRPPVLRPTVPTTTDKTFSTRSKRQLHSTPKPRAKERIITPSRRDLPQDAGPVARLAEKVADMPAIAPYSLYGATEDMFKACSLAGEYLPGPPERAVSLVHQSSKPLKPGTVPLLPPSLPAYDKTIRPIISALGEDICYPAFADTWHRAYNLPPTFSTWSQLCFLHMYIVLTRLRQFEKEQCRTMSKHLLDHFFWNAEDKMEMRHHISSRGIRGRYLKDLFEQWRGAEVSYDQALADANDAVLATAIWRNVFQAREDVDARSLWEIMDWTRRTVVGFDRVGHQDFVDRKWGFVLPWAE